MLLFINEKCFWNEWFAFVRLALAIWVYRGAINATRRQENDDGQALEINRCYFNHREKPLVSPLEKWSTNGGISTSMFVYRKDQEGTCFGWDDLVQIKKPLKKTCFQTTNSMFANSLLPTRNAKPLMPSPQYQYPPRHLCWVSFVIFLRCPVGLQFSGSE